MNPGRLRERIAIDERPDGLTVSDTGKPLEEWTEVAASVPAAVREEAGRERIRADRIEARQAVVVTMRARALTTRHRLRWNGAALTIHSITHLDARRRWIEVLCTRTN